MDFNCHVWLVLLASIVLTDFVISEVEGELSSSQVHAITKLRSLVDKQLYKSYMKDDEYLIRFLNSRKWDVQQASEMLLKTIKWRHENNIDNITDRAIDIEKGLPTTVGSFDREQRPVGVLQVGKWRMRRIVLSGKSSQFVTVIYKFMETMSQLTLDVPKAEGRNSTQAYMIIDMAGFNARDHACLSCSPLATQLFPVAESYYPRSIHKAVVVNAPRLFQELSNIILPYMSEDSKKRFFMLGVNRPEWFEILSKDIAEDQIPTYLGGTYKQEKRVVSKATAVKS